MYRRLGKDKGNQEKLVRKLETKWWRARARQMERVVACQGPADGERG